MYLSHVSVNAEVFFVIVSVSQIVWPRSCRAGQFALESESSPIFIDGAVCSTNKWVLVHYKSISAIDTSAWIQVVDLLPLIVPVSKAAVYLATRPFGSIMLPRPRRTCLGNHLQVLCIKFHDSKGDLLDPQTPPLQLFLLSASHPSRTVRRHAVRSQFLLPFLPAFFFSEALSPPLVNPSPPLVTSAALLAPPSSPVLAPFLFLAAPPAGFK